jgi:hypothetical protein
MYGMLRWAAVGALVAGLAPRALAQEESPPYRPLPIPVPAGAKVHLELDTHDEDLLGVLKSLLRGFNPAGMAAMFGTRLMAVPGGPPMEPMGAPGTAPGRPPAPPTPGPGVPGPRFPPGGPGVPSFPGGPGGVPGGPGPGAMPAAPFGGGPGGPPGTPDMAAWMRQLEKANPADILKQIHQLHLVVLTAADGSDPKALLSSYEEPYMKEGGRRLLWVDNDNSWFSMIAFHDPRGFAAIYVSGKDVLVMRMDGYPDLEPVGALVMSFVGMMGSAFGEMARGFSLSPPTPEEQAVPPDTQGMETPTPAAPRRPATRRPSTHRKVAPRRR